jgi:hypothetical protein
MTGSDPFLRTGTSLTLIFEAKQKEGLLAALAMRRMQAKEKFPQAKSVSGKNHQSPAHHRYEGIASPRPNNQEFRKLIR